MVQMTKSLPSTCLEISEQWRDLVHFPSTYLAFSGQLNRLAHFLFFCLKVSLVQRAESLTISLSENVWTPQ